MKTCNICENEIIGEVCNVTINDLEYQEICSKCYTSIEKKIIELKKTLTYQELDKLNDQFYQYMESYENRNMIIAKYGIQPRKGTLVYGVNMSNPICSNQDKNENK
jgi:ribosome-binding protein aMBF1 (putative translation factor)